MEYIVNYKTPYCKNSREKEAWAIADAQTQWDLITVNPTLVMGPGLNPKGTSESFNIMRQMGNGTMKDGIPNWGLGVVDVRDVAKVHMAAAYTPEAKGRYITSGHNTNYPEMAKLLLPRFGSRYPLPRSRFQSVALLVGPLMNAG